MVGGSSITFEAQLPEGYDHDRLKDDMSSAIEILRFRLTLAGYTEAQVSAQGENRINVEIPQIKDPEEAVQILGATAQMTFEDVDGKQWLTGSDIKSANEAQSQEGLGYCVQIRYDRR